jgi:hypothetical protein
MAMGRPSAVIFVKSFSLSAPFAVAFIEWFSITQRFPSTERAVAIVLVKATSVFGTSRGSGTG